jgi:hypothetical protein
MIKKASP